MIQLHSAFILKAALENRGNEDRGMSDKVMLQKAAFNFWEAGSQSARSSFRFLRPHSSVTRSRFSVWMREPWQRNFIALIAAVHPFVLKVRGVRTGLRSLHVLSAAQS